MARQIGLVLGVALFVAVVGTPVGFEQVHTAFQHAWWVLAGVALLAAISAHGMTPKRRTYDDAFRSGFAAVQAKAE